MAKTTNKIDLSYVAKGDILNLACGGSVTIGSMRHKPDKWTYCYQIEFVGCFPVGLGLWYAENGECGSGTGPEGTQCPLDIVSITCGDLP